jgi:hypothetical protein
MVKGALGAWPGGPKPSAFGCMDDDDPPTLQIMQPSNGASVDHDFSVRVNAHDDCQLADVKIQVMPQGLSADQKAPPFDWDLTSISGAQTITVTATDQAGHTTVSTISVSAPVEAPGAIDATAMPSAGCTVASGAFSLAGLLPSVAMLLLFPRRRRGPERRRRRSVTGALGSAVPGSAPQVPFRR